MKYTKVIPCLSMDNPIDEAIFYNDSGADSIAFFDSGCKKEDIDKNISLIRKITSIIDVPLIVCGGVRSIEDIKKLLYAGASKICMKTAPLNDINIVREAADKFGSDRIIVTIDLSTCNNPTEYASKLKAAGAGELLIIDNNKISNYTEIVCQIRNQVAIPVISSSYSTNPGEIAQLVKDTTCDSISLYNLNKHDIMDIKQEFKNNGISVNIFESAIPFSEFKLNSDGLIPVIAQHYKTGEVLMLAYMNEESYNMTIKTGKMTYYSRSRQELWTKGLTSGHLQFVKSLTIDCDKDTILAKVSQIGAACHTGSPTCFFTDLAKKEYNDLNPLKMFNEVYDVISSRKNTPKQGSYTNYLMDKGLDKILKKIGEEATEIIIAAKNPDSEDIKYEISDFLYHLMVLMVEKDITWNDILKELADRR